MYNIKLINLCDMAPLLNNVGLYNFIGIYVYTHIYINNKVVSICKYFLLYTFILFVYICT